MAEPRKPRAVKAVPRPTPPSTPEETTQPAGPFDPSLAAQMREIVSAGLTPASALDLIMRLISEVPSTSKESMDHIKMLDKLINTGRAMIETKLKSDEAADIAARIDVLESRIEELIGRRALDPTRPVEVWHDGRPE
jgi:hypothetical protein